jgi:hypothetical protein
MIVQKNDEFTLIRILMSIVVVLDLELFLINVKTIFLNDELKKNIHTTTRRLQNQR